MILTLCIDKQPKTNPSNELKTYQIDIGNRLCSCDDVYDELKITLNDVNQLEGIIKRRCGLDRFNVVYKLQQEETQTLDIPQITLFEGTNYIYIQEVNNLNMKVEYLTNVEMNKQFAKSCEVKAQLIITSDQIRSYVAQTYETKEGAETQYSEILQTTNSISQTVANNNTKANIIAKINDNTSNVKIDADVVDIEANDVLNILAGNEINMTTKNLSINSTNFSVDKNGNTTMSNANITGGNIILSSDTTTPKFRINSNSDSTKYTIYFPNEIRMFNNGLATMRISNFMNAAGLSAWDVTDDNKQVQVNAWFIEIKDSTQRTTIQPNGISTPSVTQTSKEEHKKNFEKLDNALDIIKNIDIYKYNMKTDEDSDKKHIGFVIGDKYNYSKEVTSKDNDGVDIYSFVSVCCKAIQEQQEEIKQLQERIKRLESEK